MVSLSLEEENIINSIRNIFILKKDIRKLRKKKKLKQLKNAKRYYEYFWAWKEEENYHKPVRVSNFWSSNCIVYKNNCDRNKSLSVEEYLNKIRPCLKDIINNLRKSNTWKVQLTIANNFISSIDNDEERVMHSKSDNIEIMISEEADKVIEELFGSLKSRYQNSLELMKGSEFVFDYVRSLCYKSQS